MNILIHLIAVLVGMHAYSPNQTSQINQLQNQDSLILVELDQEFGITEGSTAKLTGKEITLKLVKVSDSRCPKGVNCIRAGEIEVEIKVKLENRVSNFTLRNPTWERGGTMEASLGDGLFLRLNGAFQEQNHKNGEALQIAFIFTEAKKPIDTPKSH